ncbi:MAG: hypothetical protein Tsb009_03720 [Planctomycetaceae bacterium]
MSAAEALPLPEPPSQLTNQNPTIQQETVDCLHCGGHEFETVIIASDPITGLGGNFRLVRCRDCDLAFTNPRPTPASIGTFYPDDYQPYVARGWDESGRAKFHRAMERAVLQCKFGYPGPSITFKTRLLAALGQWRIRRSRQRQSWIPFREPGRLLDFGCGAGMFLQEMREFGWSVEGLDFSEPVAKQVEQTTGIKIHVGTLPHSELAEESFDAVTMWNSLEHVYNPRETVRHANRILRPGGVLVIGVPNFDSWGFRTFQQDWHGLELPRHLTHFTPQTLTATLEAEGYRVLSVDQIARVGWVRRSARNALKNGRGAKKLKWLRWKPVGIRVADWTERTGQADFIRAVAEKV